jgi:hypothetical protein
MRYYATASTPRVRDAMRAGLLGQIVTPAAGNRLEPGVRWVADNGVFGGTYPGDDAYLAWLGKQAIATDAACDFAVAPDVVCDAAATYKRSMPMLARIRAVVGHVAYVGQNGATIGSLPWGLFDVLFLGGDDTWKLGADGRALTAEANGRGMPVHMGRVNSHRRLRYAAAIGCASVDGTYLAFGPDRNLPRLLGWLAEIHGQGVLFNGAGVQ